MIFTQKFELNRFNKQQENERVKFDLNLSEEKNHYNELLNEQKENLRINIMPFLVLLKNKIKFNLFDNGNIVIDLYFINKENGTAIEITNKYIEDNVYGKYYVIAKSFTYKYLSYMPFDFECNVANINNEIIV